MCKRWLQLNTRRVISGQSMVEFAFAVSIFLVIIFGILEIGRLVFMTNMVANAAREGSRYIALHPDNSLAQLRASSDFTTTLILASVNDLDMSLTCATCPVGGSNPNDCVVNTAASCTNNTGEPVTVAITYTWRMGFNSNLLNVPVLNSGVPLVGRSTVGRER
jgi:Flp pilus assembly protein TadG